MRLAAGLLLVGLLLEAAHAQVFVGYNIAASCGGGSRQIGPPICGADTGEDCTKKLIRERCNSEAQACCCDPDGSCSNGDDAVCCYASDDETSDMIEKSALPAKEIYEVSTVDIDDSGTVPGGPPECALGCVSYFMAQNGDKAPTTIEEQCDFLVNYALGPTCEDNGVAMDCSQSELDGLNDILAMCNTPIDAAYDDDVNGGARDDDLQRIKNALAGDVGDGKSGGGKKKAPAGVVIFIFILVVVSFALLVYVFNKRQRDFYQSGWIVNSETDPNATPVAGNINVSVL